MYKSFFLISFFLILTGREITLSELDSIIEGEEITIKGYLLKREDGFVLSSIPAIKSCCSLKGPILKVKGEYDVASCKVVKLKGVIEKGVLSPSGFCD